ncbi:uncharacterized protein F5Z01DRAFT_413726 [Emericellopsis atlantica]|uniref:Potassium channel tetramerisation-type BTB domain-containing protein n=1 Tax=Emericellopsis atlantica TaxID=2614577 RepID=A0A9P7ZTX5_9HYPO|nr:uncharacterized protein F5Z01DRAFT_413726 [Emericellopsis atlantica]KAG9257737.1 hypothetical protein F5Z01DRAFT_413726 [Emericellopsis atlantica]
MAPNGPSGAGANNAQYYQQQQQQQQQPQNTTAVATHGTLKIPYILPHERVFPIQIGGETFNLSGASISSDAPSYFSQHFRALLERARENNEDPCAAIKTLYIDRDPATFRDIALHLQGYHVTPRDGTHFVRLFADAQFYSLPRLISQLYEESIFISIGHREFQIPRSTFSAPGNSPNFFSLGFAAFFSRPDELFPGLDREGLIRPPSILPPSVPNRDADTFADLLRILRGYPVQIRDEVQRAKLLADARYFHFKGLEQKLIAHEISFNQVRQRTEIALRLENVQKSGLSVRDDAGEPAGTSGWVTYARPYVDDKAADLVLEIGHETTKLHLPTSGDPRAEFFNDTEARIRKLFEVIATKLGLPPTAEPMGLLMAAGGGEARVPSPGHTTLSEHLVRVALPPEAAILLDGKEYEADAAMLKDEDGPSHNPRKRRRAEEPEEWTVKKGQWRLRIRPSEAGKGGFECVLVAVKIDAVSSERGRNMARGFLGS